MYSCLSDLIINCSRHFSVDIFKLYISALDHAIKLKFSDYVHLPSISKMFLSVRLSDSVQRRRGLYFRAWMIYLSFGTCLTVNIKQLCSSGMYNSLSARTWILGPRFQIGGQILTVIFRKVWMCG